MESPYIDLFESNEKNQLLKSLSSSNFGSTYIYNLMNLKRINIKTARTPNKSYQNFNFKISSRNKNGLSQEYLYFSNVKNKKVRNIYETILKNSCREKEPRMIHLKNLFRVKKKNYFIKYNDDKNNIGIIIANDNNKKKSRTSNNLPFINKSSSQKIFKLNNNNNSINNSEMLNDIENKNTYKNTKKISSLFFKNSLESNKNKNKRYKLLDRPHSIKDNRNIKLGKSKFRDYLISFEKDVDKEKNSIVLKK
jgi:hypothetical protein